MTRGRHERRARSRRDRGQVELSYLLLLTLIIVPVYLVVQIGFRVLIRYFEVSSFLVSLPFP